MLGGDHVVECKPWREVDVECDALIVDAPYSAKTHAGHDSGAEGVRNLRDPSKARRAIPYAAWSGDDVAAFVEHFAPLTRGWIVTITDHTLAPAWSGALEAAGRYVFSPLAYVAPGSRVRLGGDGPAQWSCWIVVARPRSVDFSRWGSLPGAYMLPPGCREVPDLPGGKPAWLMSSLVRDYSRRGDLVMDPCCGAGTTGVAARTLGRRSYSSDIDPKHAAIAAKRIGAAREQLALVGDEVPA